MTLFARRPEVSQGQVQGVHGQALQDVRIVSMSTIRPNRAAGFAQPTAPSSGTPHAECARMHLVPLDLKRAYLDSLSRLRLVTKPHALTPARFQLLALVGDRAMLQSSIHRALGVSRATTCRMLGSLHALGLVTRTHPAGKRRHHLVQLTAKGRRRLRAVTSKVAVQPIERRSA
jgi:DNA-binding MarR family transcriptional regulator